MKKRAFLAASGAPAAAALVSSVMPFSIAAQSRPIRVGEINSYKAQPAFLDPYRKGWELATEEVNAAGGLGGPQARGDCSGRLGQSG
jgi:branched-chain amino acid transport system substrate-binding protein